MTSSWSAGEESKCIIVHSQGQTRNLQSGRDPEPWQYREGTRCSCQEAKGTKRACNQNGLFREGQLNLGAGEFRMEGGVIKPYHM